MEVSGARRSGTAAWPGSRKLISFGRLQALQEFGGGFVGRIARHQLAADGLGQQAELEHANCRIERKQTLGSSAQIGE